jgi:hypothetical protein
MKATEMLANLLKLKELVAHDNMPAETNGICGNLTIVSQVYSYGFVEKYSVGWPEHSGDREYPVPSVNGYQYLKWRGEYGEARLRLLDYLVQQMESLGDEEVNWEEKM